MMTIMSILGMAPCHRFMCICRCLFTTLFFMVYYTGQHAPAILHILFREPLLAMFNESKCPYTAHLSVLHKWLGSTWYYQPPDVATGRTHSEFAVGRRGENRLPERWRAETATQSQDIRCMRHQGLFAAFNHLIRLHIDFPRVYTASHSICPALSFVHNHVDLLHLILGPAAAQS